MHTILISFLLPFFVVVVVVCTCILCLLPCHTRCSFIDVLSCTPTGVSEINYLTFLSDIRLILQLSNYYAIVLMFLLLCE